MKIKGLGADVATADNVVATDNRAKVHMIKWMMDDG